MSRALSAAKSSKPDADWKGFAQKKAYISTLTDTFDSKILEINSNELVNMSQDIIDSAEKVNRNVIAAEGGIGKAYIANVVANSNGICGFDKGTVIECSLATLAKYNDKITPVCFEFDAARNHKIDPTWVGREAAKLCFRFKNKTN